VGEEVIVGADTYKVTRVLHDLEDMVVVMDVVRM